jgi:hypothetical protein
MHRTQPIPETLEAVENYGTLHIYKIGASRFWQCRCWMAGRMLKESTKQEDKRKATAAAIEFYDALRERKKKNLPLIESSTLERVVNDLIRTDQLRVDRSEANPRLVKDMKYLLQKDIQPFFKGTDIKDISYQKLVDYTQHLKERNVGSNTIKWHFVVIGKILKHASKMNLLTTLPVFPTIKVKDNPREHFTKQQYELLRKTIGDAITDRVVVRGHLITNELRFLVTFMVNTFIRPSDVKHLLNKHCEIAEKDGVKYLRITPWKTKTSRNKPYISMPAAAGIFEDLTEFNKAKGYGKPDDFCFFPAIKNRSYALQTMRRQFDWVLKKANLKESNSGISKTLYSLRHTALHMRLVFSENLDMLTLANSANTSIEILQRFYLSGASVEMNLEKLHSMKNKKKNKPS